MLQYLFFNADFRNEPKTPKINVARKKENKMSEKEDKVRNDLYHPCPYSTLIYAMA